LATDAVQAIGCQRKMGVFGCSKRLQMVAQKYQAVPRFH
jgi:hypothetical protein